MKAALYAARVSSDLRVRLFAVLLPLLASRIFEESASLRCMPLLASRIFEESASLRCNAAARVLGFESPPLRSPAPLLAYLCLFRHAAN
jgi:hypothetical protein